MPPPWLSRFEVFPTSVSGAVALVTADTAAATQGPVATHPTLWLVSVSLQRPRADGLMVEDEAEAVAAVEERLTEMLEGAYDAWFVGRMYHAGHAVFAYYSRPPETAVTPDLQAFAPYLPAPKLQPDPEWLFAKHSLVPSREQRMATQTLLTVDALARAGDRLDAERQIDHCAIFADERSAQHAAGALRDAGFSVDEPQVGDDSVVLEFHRPDRPDPDRLSATTAQVEALIAPHDGTYDGWGSEIRR